MAYCDIVPKVKTNGEWVDSPLFKELLDRGYTRSEASSYWIGSRSESFKSLMDSKGINPNEYGEYSFEDVIGGWVSTTPIGHTLESIDRASYIVVNPKGGYINTLTGNPVKNRITDAAKKANGQFFGNKSVEQEERSLLMADKGTVIHAYAEAILSSLDKGKTVSKANMKSLALKLMLPVDEGNFVAKYDKDFYDLDGGSRGSGHYKSLENGVRQLHEYIKELGRDRGGYTIRTEQIIYDPRTDTGGKLDVMVIFGDGSVALFDYKSIFYATKYNPATGKYEVQDNYVKNYKQAANDAQIKEQARILNEAYGITDIREARILPIATKLGKEKGIVHLEMDINSDRSYLKMMPTVIERAKFEPINGFINELRVEKEKLNTELKGRLAQEDRDRISDRITDINITIQNLIVSEDYGYILSEVGSIINLLEAYIKNPDTELGDIVDAVERLKFYRSLSGSFEGISLSKEDRDNYEKLDHRISVIERQVHNHIIQQLSDRFDEDMSVTPRRSSSLGSRLEYMGESRNPIFRAGRSQINKDEARKYLKTEKVVKEAKALFKKIGNRDIYSKILNPDDKNLWQQYSEHYYKEVDRAIAEGDITFMQANFKPKDDWKDKFQKAYTNKYNNIKASGKVELDGETLNEWGKADLLKWLQDNDLENYTSAWTSRSAKWNLVPKNPSEWYSDQYKTLAADGLALEVYNWVRNLNKEFASIGINNGINSTPSIRKQVMERVSGGDFRGISSDFLQSLKAVDLSDDEVIGQEASRKVPIFFQQSVFTKSNQIRLDYLESIQSPTEAELNELSSLKNRKEFRLDVDEKTDNLLYSMIVYADMAYHYEVYNESKSLYDSMRILVENSNYYETGKFNELVYDEVSESYKTTKGDQNTLSNFNKFVNFYVYKQSNQDKDKKININGTDYSAIKMFNFAKSMYSANSLAGNYVSAISGGVNALLGSYMNGVKGIYYSKDQMGLARKVFATDRQQFSLISDFFDVSKQGKQFVEATKLAKDWKQRNLRYDHIYKIYETSDRLTTDTILFAMLQNYGINSQGKVQRKSKITSYLDGDERSLFDRISNGDNGDLVIEGITDVDDRLGAERFAQFRSIVKGVDTKVRGDAGHDNIVTAQTSTIGQALFQFRGWMLGSAKERFGAIRYNEDVQEYDLGRYRAFANELSSEGTRAASVIKSLLLAIFKNKTSTTDGTYANMLKEYQSKYPDDPKIQKMTVEELKEIMQAQFRAAVVELRIIALTSAAVLAGANLDLDDDDVPDYKQNFITRQMFTLLDRTQRELTFYFNPFSFEEVVKQPIPMTKLINNIFLVGINTYDEFRDTVVGEDSSQDKAGIFFYTARFIPFMRFPVDLTYDFFKEDTGNALDREDRSKGSREVQIYKR